MNDRPAHPGQHLPRRFHFVRHLAIFGSVVAVTLAAEMLSGSDWRLFWPFAGWAGVLAVHYFLASSYDVDGDWIDDRITDLRSRSYDFDHIQNIERRIKDRDDSITPPTERDRGREGS